MLVAARTVQWQHTSNEAEYPVATSEIPADRLGRNKDTTL